MTDGDTNRAAPSPGAPATRAPATVEQYRKRAEWFIERTARELSMESPSPRVVAAHAVALQPSWTTSTWRVIKSSLVFHFGEVGTAESLAAIGSLQQTPQTACLRKTQRTSGRRAKNYTSTALAATIQRIGESSSEFAGVLTSWILLGSQVGLRPHEWGQSELIYGRLNGHAEAPVIPILRVRNAKSTNGRAHGEFRHISLEGMRPEVIEMIGAFASMMSEVAAAGEYQRVYSGASKLLYRTNSELHRSDSAKWIQLYSPRHRFSADAKRSFTREEAAALLGHGTTRTAAKYYGKRRTGSGSLAVRPSREEAARVRSSASFKPIQQPSVAPALVPVATSSAKPV